MYNIREVGVAHTLLLLFLVFDFLAGRLECLSFGYGRNGQGMASCSSTATASNLGCFLSLHVAAYVCIWGQLRNVRQALCLVVQVV